MSSSGRADIDASSVKCLSDNGSDFPGESYLRHKSEIARLRKDTSPQLSGLMD